MLVNLNPKKDNLKKEYINSDQKIRILQDSLYSVINDRKFKEPQRFFNSVVYFAVYDSNRVTTQ